MTIALGAATAELTNGTEEAGAVHCMHCMLRPNGCLLVQLVSARFNSDTQLAYG